MNLAVITSDGRYQVSFKTVGPVFENEPVMSVSKKLINAKPCFWDVTESYCAKGVKVKYCRRQHDSINPVKLNFVRKLETVGVLTKQQLTVNINCIESVYQLGKKNEYYLNGVSLTKTMETLASLKGNKISIR